MTSPRPSSALQQLSIVFLLLGLGSASGCRTPGGTGGGASGASAQPGIAGAGGSVSSQAGETSRAGSGASLGNPGVVGAAGAPDAGSSSASAAGSSSASSGMGPGGATSNAGAPSSASGTGGSTALPPHIGSWRITPLGDSITGSTCGPQLLSKALISHGKTNFSFVGSNLNNQSCNGAPNVQTEGHGGYLVTDLVGSGSHAAELPKWCESNKSDLVLMQFGTNDVWSNRTPAAILAAYSTILDDLRAVSPKVIVLVAQITPLNPVDCSACEARVVALNAQIPAWATSKSTAASPVSVVDLHAAFDAASYTESSTYTTDGVHPNLAGAQLIADKWYAALVALGVP